jgi:hypothetical protein
MPRIAAGLAVAALVAAVVTPPVRADAGASAAADALGLQIVGACPDEATVRRMLGALVSPDQARAAPISVQDRGARFRVAVRDEATTLDDPGRDCGARARQAAVVAANALQPRKVILGPPEWTVEKGLVFDVASTSAGAVAAAGAEIRGAYGSKPWSVVGAAGARAPVTLELMNGWRAEVLRLPLDAGARYTSYRWKLRPWFVIGGSATVTGIIGHELVDTERDWRLDLGALAMVGATLPVFGRVGGAAALAVRWQPRPYQLQVTPAGKVGETPAWWFGLSLNYTLDGKGSSPP